MNQLFRTSVKSRVISSRLSSLLLLFQRSPIVQMLFPEARVLGGAGIGELAKWTVASVAGLGAYDTVAGATTVTQLLPNSGSLNVTAAVGSALNFAVQCTGAPGTPGSWTMSTTPPGLTHSNSKNSSTDSLSGIPTTAGTYSVTATAWENSNASGGSSPKTFTLTVGAAVITTPPSSITIASNSSTTLSVVASGTPLTYQWFQGLSGITTTPVGTNSSTFTTPALPTGANYWVKVTRGTTTATSNTVSANSPTAAVSIGAAPAITSQPAASTTINSGGTTTLTLAASGTPTPTYQWYVGTPPDVSTLATGPTATTASFTTPALSTSTSYWARATNSSGSANSNAAAVTVNLPATIATHPASTTINSGGTATLSVTAGGTGPFTYQWYQGTSGVTTTPVGTNSATYTTVPLGGNASYWVKVTNAANTSGALSNTAAITVNLPASIATHPASTTINSGTTTTLSVTAGGTGPFTYQWYQGTSGVTTIPVGTNSPSYTTIPLSGNASYWVKVTNAANTSGALSNTAAITVNLPATIVTHPASTTINSGSTATLSVTAGGTSPFAYQWYQGTSGVTTTPVGTNSPSYTTIPLSGNASYWVKVTNAANFTGVNSNVATVTVNAETFANWQTSLFTPTQLSNPLISGPTADPDGDGITNEKEYTFGLLPLTNDPSPSPTMLNSPGQLTLGFIAKAATGSGYAGKTRHYAIEGSESLGSGSWTVIPGYQDIIATGQTVSCATATTSPHKFYQLRVWLTP